MRRGQKPEGGPHFQNTVLDVCSNRWAKREMEEHRFQMGGPGTTGPPAGDGPGRGPPRPPLESPLLLMALQISASRSLNTAISLSVLSFYKPTDQKTFLTDHVITCVNGLTDFVCLWCNARIVAIGRKVRFHHMLPFMTKQRSRFGCGYLETALEVAESLIPNSNHSKTTFAANSIVFATFVQ